MALHAHKFLPGTLWNSEKYMGLDAHQGTISTAGDAAGLVSIFKSSFSDRIEENGGPASGLNACSLCGA
jgi:hypothetical protein